MDVDKKLLSMFALFLVVIVSCACYLGSDSTEKFQSASNDALFKTIKTSTKVKKEDYIDKLGYIDIVYKNSDHLYSKKSQYQKIDVYRNEFFGNILVIDDDLQLTEHDEDNYHEMMAHVPLNYLPYAKRVLLVGGGDGGTLREICQHDNVEEIIMVELDKEVVRVAKKYFSSTSTHFNDSRVKLIYENGITWVKNAPDHYKNYFDVIIVDSTDYSTGQDIFSDDFYITLEESILRPHGILVFNCQSLSWSTHGITDATLSMRKKFKYAYIYQLFQPTYASGHYGLMFCSNHINPKQAPINWQEWDSKNIDCDYYNKQIHESCFHLPEIYTKSRQLERLGTLFQLDVKGVKFDKLNDMKLLNEMLSFIINVYRLNTVGSVKKQFKPHGITILIGLAESHLTIHTWPEKGAACIDLFMCGNYKYNVHKTNLQKIVDKYLRPQISDLKQCERAV